MTKLRFVWDIKKAKINKSKHSVSFEEAETVFYDQNGRLFYDSGHCELEEDRFLFLGISSRLRLLLVCHCFRESDRVIRIISARKATKNEATFYTQ